MSDIKNSKVANFIRDAKGSKELKIAIGVIGFLCGIKLIFSLYMKFWMFFVFPFNHWKLTLMVALIFGFIYSGGLLYICGKILH